VRLAADVVLATAARLGRPILLIPHVTTTDSDDDAFLRRVASAVRSRARGPIDMAVMPASLNAAEIKWVIGQCRCMIGARTHATIASLSSCVPTVTLAYSTKGYGINLDVFGHTEFVLSPEEVSPEAVVSRAERCVTEGATIREALADRIPALVAQAESAGDYISALLESRRGD
jgi:polysaccharide pyruvyl transferase WcaK-like protein